MDHQPTSLVTVSRGLRFRIDPCWVFTYLVVRVSGRQRYGRTVGRKVITNKGGQAWFPLPTCAAAPSETWMSCSVGPFVTRKHSDKLPHIVGVKAVCCPRRRQTGISLKNRYGLIWWLWIHGALWESWALGGWSDSLGSAWGRTVLAFAFPVWCSWAGSIMFLVQPLWWHQREPWGRWWVLWACFSILLSFSNESQSRLHAFPCILCDVYISVHVHLHTCACILTDQN